MSSNLIAELTDAYATFKNMHNLTISLDEIDGIFHIRDFILSNGYVSRQLSQQICTRIAETFMNWNMYLHGLVMPDSHHLIQMNESKFLTGDEKKRVLALIARSMHIISRITLLHARPDEQAASSLISDSVLFWKEIYQPQLVSFIETLRVRWG